MHCCHGSGNSMLSLHSQPHRPQQVLLLLLLLLPWLRMSCWVCC
jgi:hypothetical protein